MLKNKKIIKFISILGILFTYLILDIGIRFVLWRKIEFVSYRSFSPLAFSLSYILILMITMIIFNKKFKLIYILTTILSNIYLLAQMICFKILGNFFSLVSFFSAGEAADYFGYAIKNISNDMLIICLLSILSMIVVLVLVKRIKCNIFEFHYKWVGVFCLIILIVIFRLGAIKKLGPSVSNNAWDSWKKPKNIYDNFSNNNRSFMVSGMYEYIFRDIYLYAKKRLNPNARENIKEINEYFDNLSIEQTENEYTGIFKDKNLIMIMLESIDNWLVTDENMPTMKLIEDTGINFTNRYAPVFGAGMTINSEFASVSGLYSITSDKAIYNYNKNNFDYTLPSLFKKKGYNVNSIHMNNGEFYNRKNFHLGLGFDHHYPLYDMKLNDKFDFDSVIALNDDSYHLITSGDKFMTLITTYSAHVPYENNYMCDELVSNHKDLIVSGDDELTCLNLLSNETDKFIKELLRRLKEDKYLDDTVIVLYSDHYSYGYSNVNLKKGTTDNNLIQKTPLVIWSSDIEHKNIDTIMDTADIPITLFNMFGIEYDPKIYMGTDVFSKYHENFVYFSDFSWYDGVYYSKTGDDSEYTRKVSEIVNKKVDINEKMIFSDYYKYYKKNN